MWVLLDLRARTLPTFCPKTQSQGPDRHGTRGFVDKDIVKLDVLRVAHGHGPHLAL
jgi:hypothetical protein